MAVGLITTPPAWQNGTVGASTWFQNVQDTLNSLFGTRANQQSLVLGASQFQIASNGQVSALELMHLGSVSYWNYAGGGTNPFVTTGIPLSFKTGSITAYQTVDAISVKAKPTGSGSMTFKLWQQSGMSGTNAVTVTQIGSTLTSSGTGYQTLSFSTLGLTPTADISYFIAVNFSSVSDSLFGATITYDNSLM